MNLGLIPARAGSKRCPGKNTRELGGITLLGWAIACGLHAKTIDVVVVSSEDDAILNLAVRKSAEPLLRPAWMATDTASPYWAMAHALQRYPADHICLLQPTSPFRQPMDVDECFAAMGKHPAAVSVEIGHRVPNGAVYWARSDWLLTRLAMGEPAPFDSETPAWYFMPAERSLDIDTEADFARAVRMLDSEIGGEAVTQ